MDKQAKHLNKGEVRIVLVDRTEPSNLQGLPGNLLYRVQVSTL